MNEIFPITDKGIKKIVIFSDSLGMPRPNLDPENRTHCKDIYAYRLRGKLQKSYAIEMELCYFGGLDTEDAVVYCEQYIAFREPDIVVLQIGINDCAPRVFSKRKKSILFNKHFRKITFNIFYRVIQKCRYPITKYFPKTYVNKDNFEKNLNEVIKIIQQYNPDAKIYAVSICFPSERILKKSCDYYKNISEYNKILEKVFKDDFINVAEYKSIEGFLIDDGIHLTKYGHEVLADLIIDKIKRDFQVGKVN